MGRKIILKKILNLDILYRFDIIGISYEVKEKHV